MLGYLRPIVLAFAVLSGIWSVIASSDTESQQEGNLGVNLARGSGEGWYKYAGTTADPLSGGHAIIQSVTIPPGASFSLAHGQSSQLYHVDPGQSHAFDGSQVEGPWIAQFDGNRADAPAAIAFTVQWRSPTAGTSR
jgi:hypothetical protein